MDPNMFSMFANMMGSSSGASSSFDRKSALDRHNNGMAQLGSGLRAAGSQAHQLKLTSGSNAPNASLPQVEVIPANRITLDDIIKSGVERVHAGKFLLCRSIGISWKINAINLVVDDPEGDKALALSLYNYRPKIFEKRSSDADLVPIGTIIALMNPWFKLSMAGFPVLRCENPAQFHILDPSHSILAGIIWKVPVALPILPSHASSSFNGALSYDNMEPSKAGLCYFADKNYVKAIECFTKAVNGGTKNALIYANRAGAYLAMNKPLLALEDAECGLDLEKSNLKLLFRKGKALMALKRYEECLEFLKTQVKRGGIAEIAQLFTEAQLAVRESKTGRYDMVKIFEEATTSLDLQHAEFFDSDLVEVNSTAGCDRGLVAKVAIPPGTLVLASKAFMFHKADVTDVNIRIDGKSKSYDIGHQELVAKISEKLLDQPHLAKEFYQLYAGESLRWIENFGDMENPIDIARIEGIVNCNSFQADERLKTVHDCGVWIQPAYINHSCSDINCVRPIVGDFMFVRTIKEVKAGEQLFFQYIQPDSSFEERDAALQRCYGFVCNCRLCLLESSESPEVRKEIQKLTASFKELRTKLVETINSGSAATFKSKSKNKAKKNSAVLLDLSQEISVLENWLQVALSLRKDEKLNYLACCIRDLLGSCHMEMRNCKEAVSLFESCFAIYEEFGLCFQAYHVGKKLNQCFNKLSNPKQASVWDNKCRSLCKLILGDEKLDMSLFH